MKVDLGIIIAAIALLISFATLLFTELRARGDIRAAWYREVVSWARDCVKELSAAHELCATHVTDADHIRMQRHRVLAGLTSLIDEGRFLFENDRSVPIGLDKPRAYQGARPRIMDYLVVSYDRVRDLGDNPDPAMRDFFCEHIIDAKRRFVSDVQEAIEPRWFARRAQFDKKI